MPTSLQEHIANALIELLVCAAHLGLTPETIQECVRHADRVFEEEPPFTYLPTPTVAPHNPAS